MGAGRGGGDVGHLGTGPGPEGAAGGRQDDAFDGVALVRLQRLEYGAVLAVDGYQPPAAPAHGLDEERAGRDEAFLVGKRDVGAAARGGKCGRQAGIADDRRHDPFGVPFGGLDQSEGPAATSIPVPERRSLSSPYFAGSAVTAHPGAEFDGLAGEQRDIAASRKRRYLEGLASAKLPDDIEGIAADRTGRSEYRDAARREMRHGRTIDRKKGGVKARWRAGMPCKAERTATVNRARRRGRTSSRTGRRGEDRMAGKGGSGTTREDVLGRDAADPLGGLRGEFALRDGLIYLDGNSLGALQKSVMRRVEKCMREEWGRGLIGSWNGADWVSLPQTVGARIAPLIGAGRSNVVVTDATSVNLFKVLAAAVMARPGRRVIVSERSNFPTDLYVAEGLAALAGRGHELRLIDDPEAVEAAIGPDVAVVMLTHVNYRTGRMLDMEALTEKAHAAGALTVWDLAHSAGAVPVDLRGRGRRLRRWLRLQIP